MQTEQTVYVVKFDKGYYAAKQPNYNWSFTDNPILAKHYKTAKLAQERADWGLGLISGACKEAVVEAYDIITTMKRKQLT